ncbi:glycosyl hydrolase 108 family protein [Helicobacter sp. 11S02629-2]|uniref:glycoside hydrolase family 108 protein n=1 Tax=Helicobacter sp. 11S02629-2 TaxID=1476195 RepID=UPI000BA681EE|nr:glycosyl hydrolase 108 family protein [Helicobacter sp. 11S02629-2]PAF44170.1 hypothetical protein BKH40_06125 [Helicobacter sp. 11S02629-2]
MADFKQAKEKTLKHEGGYSYDADDLGGETIYGIAREKNPSFKGWKKVDEVRKKVFIEPTTPSKAKGNLILNILKNDKDFQDSINDFYKSNYWEKIKGDDIKSQDLANQLFDMAVNMGVSRSVKLAQSYLKVKEDGILGDKTLQALNNIDAEVLNLWLVDARKDYYERLARARPALSKFLNGWKKRSEDFA